MKGACRHKLELPTDYSILLYLTDWTFRTFIKCNFSAFLAWVVLDIVLRGYSGCRWCGTRRWFVMVKDVPEGQKAPQQQQLAEQWDQHQKQSTSTQMHFILTLLSTFCPAGKKVCFASSWKVSGLQFGRAVQIEHRRQPRHRLHQELRSVPASRSSIPRIPLPCLNASTISPLKATALLKRAPSSASSMWEPSRSCSSAWARPCRSLWSSSLTLMPLRWGGAGGRTWSRKTEEERWKMFLRFNSKVGSFPSCRKTRRWFWECPSMASKWPRWTSVWVKKKSHWITNANKIKAFSSD